MEKEIKSYLLKLEQVCPETGISIDYVNEFSLISESLLKSSEKWEKHWKNVEQKGWLKKQNGKLIIHYEERYPPTKYDLNLRDPKVKARIDKLNQIVDELNDLYTKKQFNQREFARLFIDAYSLMIGEDRISTDSFVEDLKNKFDIE